METDKLETAFHWIVDLMEAHGVPYQFTGGFAARCYGAARLVNDLDIDIPFARAEAFLQALQPFLPPDALQVVKEGDWNLVYYIFDYKGQTIEIGDGDHVYISDGLGGWIWRGIDFGKSLAGTAYGRPVMLMPYEELRFFKNRRGRPEDLRDLAEMAAPA